MKPLRWVVVLGGTLLTLLACSALPPLEPRQASFALPAAETANTAIGQSIASDVAANPDKSGIMTLPDAQDAFAARLVLARAAERTLDIQYYIWRNDKSGQLLLQALYDAAQRGVRVRLLLDDLNTAPVESKLVALHQHPHIEVRLFNPFTLRGPRALGFMTDFSRANRRMHNKSYTSDNQVTIIGGRNIGDDYFSGADGVLFADLDVLAVGNVVEEVSGDFDGFWNSDSSYPLDLLVSPASEATKSTTIEALFEQTEAHELFVESVESRVLFTQMMNGEVPLIWADTRMVSDDPRKALGEAENNELLTYALRDIVGKPQHSLYLVSPYFVPTQTGVEALERIASSGVAIHILTNSFAATDVAIVHSGYAKWRKRLLRAGIRLYEMRPNVVRSETETDTPRFASSASSLHAKTFAIDGERVFIGSFNFDPRSAALNTELGFVIENAQLAQQTADIFALEVPYSAYELKLSPSGRVYWLHREPGYLRRLDIEPETGWFERASMRFFSWLPIDWLL